MAAAIATAIIGPDRSWPRLKPMSVMCLCVIATDSRAATQNSVMQAKKVNPAARRCPGAANSGAQNTRKMIGRKSFTSRIVAASVLPAVRSRTMIQAMKAMHSQASGRMSSPNGR